MPLALLLTALLIRDVTPPVGRPHGGERIQINGSGFRAPIRVLFDVGAPLPIESFVIAATETRLEVLTPAINLEGGQQRVATLIVITEAGTANEQRAELRDAFTFRNELLVPRIHLLVPRSGSVAGGLHTTILGDGFQAPVQVSFFTGSDSRQTEVRVINVAFSEVRIETPPAADVGAAPDQPVHVRLRNIASGTETVAYDAFRYHEEMRIDAISPSSGPAEGGTLIEIVGQGFRAPVIVQIGNIPATPISVTGTRIVARTNPVEPRNCSGLIAPVEVMNIETGNLAAGPSFSYVAAPPQVTAMTRVARVGDIVEIHLAGANGDGAVVHIGGATIWAVMQRGTLRFVVPPTVNFPQAACTSEGIDGTGPAPFEADVSIVDSAGCIVAIPGTITLFPAEDAVCTVPPSAQVIRPEKGRCLRFGRTTSRTQRIVIENRSMSGRAWLNVASMSLTGPDARAFELALAPGTSPWASPGGTIQFDVTSKGDGYRSAVAHFNTNDPERPVLSVCLSALHF